MKNHDIIKKLGLSDGEVDAYLTLLSLGGAPASKVASSMGVKRTTVYPILKSLSQKGFATTYFKNNVKLFYPQKPANVIRQQEKKIEAFESIVPMLQSLQGSSQTPFGLQYIETLAELKRFYENILDEYAGKTYYDIGSAVYWEQLDTDWFVEFRKRRGQKKVHTKLILSIDSKYNNPTDPSFCRTWKYTPEGYTFKSTMDIYDDKVMVVSPKLSSLAVVIQIPAMVDVFRATFEMLWDLLPEPDDVPT
ncbi:hypothetical protein H6758_03585 [Candidatus Nomurabacteria bacterium]|nr:hypothetical protein [Candidatus Nomurabacteria bacterium]